MRRAIVRCAVYLVLAGWLSYLTYPAWRSITTPGRERGTATATPGRIFIATEFGTKPLVTTVRIVSATGTSSGVWDYLDPPDSGANGSRLEVQLSKSSIPKKGISYAIFTGGFASIARVCRGVDDDGHSMTDVPVTALPAALKTDPDGILSLGRYKEFRVLRLDWDRGLFGTLCSIPSASLWTNVRQKYYYNAPPIFALRWRGPAQGAGVPSSGAQPDDCFKVDYSSGPGDRVELVETSAKEDTLSSPIDHRWTSCLAERSMWLEGSYGYSFIGSPLSRIVVTDVGAETANERNLFIGGVALGVIGAFLVEFIGVGIDIAERLVPKWGHMIDRLSLRWQGRPEAQRDQNQLTLW